MSECALCCAKLLNVHFDNLTMRERERDCYLISVEKGLVRFE